MTDFIHMTMLKTNFDANLYRQWAHFCNDSNGKYTIKEYADRFETIEVIPEIEPYYILRKREYPALGDMIDALCKKEQGDETEWISLLQKRNEIKMKYPK